MTLITRQETKLITVTRRDITPGYQTVQSVHALADFAHEHQKEFFQWKSNSNSIICLSIEDENSLIKLIKKLKDQTYLISCFYEPDIDNQLTSICVYGTSDIRRTLSYLPLILKQNK